MKKIKEIQTLLWGLTLKEDVTYQLVLWPHSIVIMKGEQWLKNFANINSAINWIKKQLNEVE